MAQTHRAAGAESLPIARRVVAPVVAIDVDAIAHGHGARAGLTDLGWKARGLDARRRYVASDLDLDGMQHAEHAWCGLVEIVAHAVLELADVDHRVRFGDAD